MVNQTLDALILKHKHGKIRCQCRYCRTLCEYSFRRMCEKRWKRDGGIPDHAFAYTRELRADLTLMQ